MSDYVVSSTTEEAVRPGLVREGAEVCVGFFVFQVLRILRLEPTRGMAVVLRGEDVLWIEDDKLEIF